MILSRMWMYSKQDIRCVAAWWQGSVTIVLSPDLTEGKGMVTYMYFGIHCTVGSANLAVM